MLLPHRPLEIIRKKKNLLPLRRGQVLHVCGKHKMGSDEKGCWETWIQKLQLQSRYKMKGGGRNKSFCVSTILEREKKKNPPPNGN